MKITSLAVLVLLPLALVDCKKGVDGSCRHSKDCKDTLVCMDQPMGMPKCMELASAASMCESGDRCKTVGFCSVSSVAGDEFGMCVAKSEADCNKGACATNQFCTYDPTTHTCGR